MRWRSMAPVLVAAVAAVGGCGDEGETYSVEPTSRCLSAAGVRVIWFEGPGEVDGFAPSGGGLVMRGAYDVTVRFGKDAAEAEAVAEKLEQDEVLDPFDGGEYRFEVRRRSNAVVSARVPKGVEPTSDLKDVLDAAERLPYSGVASRLYGTGPPRSAILQASRNSCGRAAEDTRAG